MFNGNQILSLENDHLDISFGKQEAWPALTPLGSIKSFSFEIGDRDVGPVVLLGIVTPVEGEVLDWPHSIDPPHYHGSDQFRVVLDGEWTLIGKPLPPGSFSFQESGLRYREHPGGDGAAWTMLVIGDRRGARPTILREADRTNLIDTGKEHDKPVDKNEAYPHPAGPRGVAAIATSQGPCERGYLFSSFEDLMQAPAQAGVAVLTGVFGEKEAGPVAHLLRCAAATEVLPALTCATEILLLVSDGSCRIGDQEYRTGDLRVQGAGSPMPALVSGAGGLSATLVIADRRVQPQTDVLPAWFENTDQLVAQLAH